MLKLSRLLMAATILTAPLAGVASAGPATCTPSEVSIAGEDFTPFILKARTLVDGDPRPRRYVTVFLTNEGRSRLADLTRARHGETLDIAVNGQTVMSPVIEETLDTGLVKLAGGYSRKEALTLARIIDPACRS